MKTIACCKASPFTKSDVVDNLLLEFNHEPPELSLNELTRYFDAQSLQIVDAMMTHLPQGLTDRILARLMTAKASLLVIPAESVTGGISPDLCVCGGVAACPVHDKTAGMDPFLRGR